MLQNSGLSSPSSSRTPAGADDRDAERIQRIVDRRPEGVIELERHRLAHPRDRGVAPLRRGAVDRREQHAPGGELLVEAEHVALRVARHVTHELCAQMLALHLVRRRPAPHRMAVEGSGAQAERDDEPVALNEKIVDAGEALPAGVDEGQALVQPREAVLAHLEERMKEDAGGADRTADELIAAEQGGAARDRPAVRVPDEQQRGAHPYASRISSSQARSSSIRGSSASTSATRPFCATSCPASRTPPS